MWLAFWWIFQQIVALDYEKVTDTITHMSWIFCTNLSVQWSAILVAIWMNKEIIAGPVCVNDVTSCQGMTCHCTFHWTFRDHLRLHMYGWYGASMHGFIQQPGLRVDLTIPTTKIWNPPETQCQGEWWILIYDRAIIL